MASNVHPPAAAINPETPITIKVAIDGQNRKFKLPLKELTVALFEQKLRSLLSVPQDAVLILERYSDSVGAHVSLQASNPSAYKQLYRAAKAKLKLRIRATIGQVPDISKSPSIGLVAAVTRQPIPSPVSLLDMAPNQDEFAHLTQRPAMTSPVTSGGETLIPAHASKTTKTPASRSTLRTPCQPSKCLASANTSPRVQTLPLRDIVAPASPPVTLWRVYCNNCETTMENVHFHCSICDQGDYDLCEKCVNWGVTCPGESHWLIKRYTVDGKMINSTTERIAPKVRPVSTTETTPPPQPIEVSMPGSFKAEMKAKSPPVLTRTCNSCVEVVAESLMVNCVDCDDFDICMPCHLGGKHGHHPGHTFKTIDGSEHKNREVMALCAPGRNFRHAAICDGCNIEIRGVRYKCLNCPDWDYCNKCYANAPTSHPEHRFAPLYEAIGLTSQPLSQHWGIYCDGPLCKGKTHQSYIKGIRYKCAVCHDTDFCANCEAHPNNKHNHTHPLIQFRTQVTNVSVTTIEESNDGKALTHGDKVVSPGAHPSPPPPPPPPPPPAPIHRAEGSQWQPSPMPFQPANYYDRPLPKTLPLPYHVQAGMPQVADSKSVTPPSNELDAHFIRDRIVDGTPLPPSTPFMQSWTLKNPGPHAWPVGCSVRAVGGDNMLNLDTTHPSSVKDLNLAQMSNTTFKVVEVGQEATFVVVMRTRAREGRQISYWRLKAADGTPFGHKLWCDIEVKNGAPGIAHPALPWCFSAHNAGSANKSGALADYQMQLLLLEQQNKKRLMMARQEQQSRNEQQISTEQHAAMQQQQAFTAAIQKIQSGAIPSKPTPAVPATAAPEAKQPIASPVQAPVSVSGVASDDSAASTMVFPKLEKESPTSSTQLEPTKTATEENSNENRASAKTTTAPAPVPFIAQDGEFEDDESLELDESEDDEDDGFSTDEEYDILDASDDEVVNGTRY